MIAFKKLVFDDGIGLIEMLTVLLQALAVAALGLIAPGSITVVILLLMSDRGWRNGLSFALGYIVMYSLIGSGVLVLGVNKTVNSSDEQSMTTSILLLATICSPTRSTLTIMEL